MYVVMSLQDHRRSFSDPINSGDDFYFIANNKSVLM